jgi:hypothetical protein
MQRLICLALVPLFFSLNGCKTNAPMIENHRVTYQRKLNAVHHWDILAKDLAKAFHAHGEFAGRTVYLEIPQPESDFSRAFEKLVISALTDKGFRVAANERAADLKLIVGAQAVFHGRRYGFASNGTDLLGAITLELRNFLTGDAPGSPGQTRGELLVTSWVREGKSLPYCRNQIAYIPVKDASLYLTDPEWERFRKTESAREDTGSWLYHAFRDDSRW